VIIPSEDLQSELGHTRDVITCERTRRVLVTTRNQQQQQFLLRYCVDYIITIYMINHVLLTPVRSDLVANVESWCENSEA